MPVHLYQCNYQLPSTTTTYHTNTDLAISVSQSASKNDANSGWCDLEPSSPRPTLHCCCAFSFSSSYVLLPFCLLGVSEPSLAVCHVDSPRRNWSSHMPQHVISAKPCGKKMLCKKCLEIQCSDQWRTQLELALNNPPGHVRAWAHWYLHNTHTCSIFKPAPYLTHQSSPYHFQLLWLRTQHTIHTILSHLYYAFRNLRPDYQDRACLHCLTTGTTILGHEVRMICHWPATQVVLENFTSKSQGLTRLLDLLTFEPCKPDAPGAVKELKEWIQEAWATTLCGDSCHMMPSAQHKCPPLHLEAPVWQHARCAQAKKQAQVCLAWQGK